MERQTLSRARGLKPFLLVMAGAVLAGVVALSYREWSHYSRGNAEAARARGIVESCDRVLASLLDAETGQRGFLLTGQERYLEPYNRALQELPAERAALRSSLAGAPADSADIQRFDSLVEQKLSELRQTIDVRRTEGAAPALAIVLSDRGKQTMDAIRALCAAIQHHENAAQAQAAADGEAAARMVLLATVAGSLILLFLFAAGFDPSLGAGRAGAGRAWYVRYGVGVLASAAALLLRMAMTPLVGPTEMVFAVFLPAVLFSAWFGGFRPGALCIVLSALAADYYFAEPPGSLAMRKPADQIGLVIFTVIGFGVALLSDAQRRAVFRARSAESAERRERRRFETTLASIGDGVIATDPKGRITFANKVALALVKRQYAEISGVGIGQVFRVVNELTHAPIEGPIAKVLREGVSAGLANHTVLLAADGSEVPIADSAAPIRGAEGAVEGAVLVFRDVTERRRAEEAWRLLASIVESSDDAIISKDLAGTITSWNQGAERMFGYSREEIIGRPISILAVPGREDQTPAILERIRRGEHVEHYRTLRRARDGRVLHVSLTVSPLYDAAGRIVGASKIVRDFTAEVQAQNEIAEHRERLRVTLSSIGDAVIATDTKGRVSYLNPVAAQATGWTVEEATGRPLEEVFRIVNEYSRQPAENPVARVLREGRVVGLANHTVLIRRDGAEIFIDDSAAPIRDAAGAILGVVMVFRDNSDRRQIERQLEESEKRYHRAVEAAPNGMVVVNREGEIVLVNTFAEKLFGYARQEMLGKPVEMLVPERFRGAHPAHRAAFSLRPEARPMGAGRELYGRRKDGTEFPVEIGLNPIETEREALVLSSIVDITERAQAAAATRLLASVVESSVDGIVSKDLDGIVTSWNNGATRLFGYSAAEMVGRTISALIPDGREDETPMVLGRIRRGEPVEPYETVRRAKNGALITVSITWSPIRDSSGRVIGASKIVRDITERKIVEAQRLELLAKERALAAERALRETEAELARVVRVLSVGELATSIAHEINQPLAGVVTNAEAGLRWLSGPSPNIEEARESLSLVVRDGNRASAVIRRIREFLKKGAQDTALLDMNEVIQETLELARAELEKRSIALRAELAPGLPHVRGDRIPLQQVVLNLLMNGADAMAPLPKPRDLVLQSKASDGAVVVSVRDSGIGIAPQDLPRIFDALFTTKPSGMGMGLSISRTIIEAHGGRIWAELNQGPGLSVHFSLPAEAL
ncbi:MAG TPA: PAS domain S-box protein [Bryobacteraceae bacterium]|nr:PAS domain S-box protein [Bryobacteraceae bacterium]